MKKERIHVLLVEDEEAHAELIRRAFESQGDVVRLSVASSLEEARVSLAESLPDLAIVDLFLPDGRGLELLDEDVEQDYPVVIVTSHGDEEVAVEAMKAGALQYVVKSEVALAELPHKVDTALRQWGHIVERKQAQKALHSSEEHFRSLIENALDIITVIDEDGSIQYVSPSFQRLLGHKARFQDDKNYLELIHPDDQESVTRMVRQAFAQPPTEHMVYRQRHKDGSWRFLEGVGSSYEHSTDGFCAVINSRDITENYQAAAERKELEGRLRHAQKWEMVANLSGDIAREFSHTVNPIIDCATMALQEAPQGSKARASLEQVLAASDRARRLAERIFVFSRRDAPRSQKLQLGELVGRELEALRSKVPDNVELRQDLGSGDAEVIADPEQMQEILRNLFSNALYAMRGKGGLLEVRLGLEGGGDDRQVARLTVRDTGHGMDRGTAERALEAFFTTKGGDEAVGLGLSVAHAIVASHGGELTVSSQPGEGTSIQVDLPCA